MFAPWLQCTPRVVVYNLQSGIPTMTHPTSKNDELVRIDLNDTQKMQVKQATGKDADAIELNAQELEARIAPRRMAVQ